jgi:hypothetical protein
MDRILIAGYACIVLGFVIAYIFAMRERVVPKQPCAFCGKLLSPPLYACKHEVGDGRDRTSAPGIAMSAGGSRRNGG